MIPTFRFPLRRAALAVWLGVTGFSYSAVCDDDGSDDQGNASGDFTNSACVQGVAAGAVKEDGGGGVNLPALSGEVQMAQGAGGLKHRVIGASSDVMTPGKPVNHPIRPGQEYKITWTKGAGHSVRSLHSTFAPKGLPAGYQVQKNTGDGWVPGNQIDETNSGSEIALSSVDHRFRVLRPVREPGQVGELMFTDAKLMERRVALGNGDFQPGVYPVSNPLVPAYMMTHPSAVRFVMALGAALEDGRVVTAGDLVFHCEQPGNINPTVNPSFLSFEGPDRAGTGVVVKTQGSNWIRQIRAPEIFVDVIWSGQPQNVTSFELRLYPPSAVAGQSPAGSSLYSPTGSPHTTWTVARTSADNPFAMGVLVRKWQDGAIVRQAEFAAQKINENYKTRRIEGVEVETVESTVTARQNNATVTIAGKTFVAGSSLGWTQERTQTTTLTRNGNQASKTIEKFFFASQGMGEGLYERRQAFDSGGGQELVSQFWYHWFGAEGIRMGTLEVEAFPDGSWVYHVQGDNGMPAKLRKPYEGSPVRPWDATDTNCVLETLEYEADPFTNLSTYNPAAYEDAMSILPSGVTTSILGTVVSKTTSSYSSTTVGGQPTICRDTRYYRNATDYEEDDEERFHDTATGVPVGMPASRIFSTGERHTFSYERGDFNPTTRVFTPSGSGITTRVTKTVGASWSPDGLPNKTTRTLTVRTGAGVTLQETTQIYTGSGYDTATVTDYFYDAAGRLTEVSQDGRTIRSIVHNGLTRTITAEDGQTTVITEDILGRITSDAKVDGPTASTVYNTNTKTTTIGGLTRSVTTDMAGRETGVTATNGQARGFSYPNNGRDREITYPGSQKVLETRHPGGLLKSVTNTSGGRIVPRHYTYGTNTNGSRWTKEDLVTLGNVRTTTTTTDWQGNEIATEMPAPSGSGTLTVGREYVGGLLRKETFTAAGGASSPGLAPRLFEYDNFGELHREGRDFNSNGTLDPSSNDPIIEHDRRYEKIGSDWYGVREVRQYLTNGNATPTTLQIVKSRLKGLSGGTAGKVVVIDANGVETVAVRTIDRPNKTVITVTSRSDRDDTTTQVEINGLLKSSATSGDTVAETYEYDSLERLWKTTDAHTGAVTSRLYNAQGLLQTVTEEALPRTTTWNYHAPSHANAGQVSQVINADSKSTWFSYNGRGQLVRVWGAAAHPEEREYNAYGDLTKTTGFRAGSGWTGATWPAGTTGTGDTITYDYYPATGLLKERIDALTKKTEYTWRNNGNLHTRKWARNVTTTWSYDTSGLETSRTYSGGTATPGVTTTRDRAGRALTMTDASGLRTYARNAAGLVNSTTITGSGILSGYTTTIGRDVHGRPESASITFGANTLYAQTRAWQPGSGRLRKVVSGGHEAEYLYAANSDLIREVIWRKEIPGGNGETAATLGRSRLFDDLGRVTSVRHIKAPSTGGPELVGSQTYAYDILDRRETATFEDGSFWDYDYNDRGELTSADKKLPGGGSPYAGQQFRFNHDNAGNRLSKESGGDASGTGRRTHTSTANALNQRASQTTPATFDVIGYSPAPTVTVNGTAAARQGDYFRRELTASNSSAAAWTAVTVSDGGTPVTGNILTPQASVTPSYDDDGNLLSDGVWTYTWDAENRLVKAVRNLTGIPYREIRFDYDGNDRLIQKRVYHASGGAVVVTEKYLHESGRRLLTVNASNQPVQSFHWGLDVSGTQDNAAGAGGLLWIHDHASGIRHLVCTDGNANVTHLVNAANGAITAAYEYSPHGELLRATGAYAFANPFRFSTKAQDDLTGLLDYGRRFYKPDWGVWLSRDPLGDIDGLNLYGFCGNDPVNRIDVSGYYSWSTIRDVWLNPVSWARTGAESVTDPNYWNQVGDNGKAMGRGVYNGAKGLVEGIANLPELADFVASGEAFEMIDRLLNDPAYQEAMMKELGKEFCQWLKRLQSNDGAFEMYGESAFNLLSGTGALKVINAAKKLKGMQFAKRLPKDTAAPSEKVPNFGCFVAGTIVATSGGEQAIETLLPGQRVLTSDEDDASSGTAVDPSSWRQVTLRLQNPDSPSTWLDVVILRPLAWIETHGVDAGAVVPFELEELGIAGLSEILSVDPCPVIESGPGRVVLATITHVNGDLRVLRLADGEEIELTGTHRLFSLDRGEWIATKDLRPGETLKTRKGQKEIVSIESKPGAHRVYNIEVETEHCFFIGAGRVLSHNTNPCAQPNYVDLTDAKGRTHILDGDSTGGGHRPGTGAPGKSEFPSTWSDDKILHEISDVATDPASKITPGRGGRTIAEGTRDGVDIRTVVERDGSRIVTGFPTNVPRNP